MSHSATEPQISGGRNPKLDTAPPPPYSEQAVPTGALNVNAAGSASTIVPQRPPLQQVPSHHYYTPPPQAPYGPSNIPSYPNANHGSYQPVVGAAGGIPAIVVQAPTPGPHHHQFGPTPLNDRQVLLPYAFYGERAIADARARWRFCAALLWAMGIYVGVAFLVGVEGFGDGWWTFLYGPIAAESATI